MAETALYLALRKINLASRRDDSSDVMGLVIFQSRLRRIESELRMIHCFLDQLETRYNDNHVLVSWIAEAQKLGRLVEETVDVYIHRIFQPSQKLGRRRREVSEYFMSIVKLLGTPVARRAAFIQLMELEEELEHLSKMKKLWVQVASGPEHAYIPSIHQPESLPYHLVSDLINEEPVGFHMEMAKLTARLLRQNDGACSVVSVWGLAGSGKTTHVRFVYQQVRRNFDCYAWISMSGCSNAEEILIKNRRELRLEGDTAITNRHTMETSSESWRGRLKEKKCLIVFDDVKVTDGISEVRDLLQKGSRIIIITTIEEVTTKVTQVDEDRISLARLNDTTALDLFGKVVSGARSGITKEQLTDFYNNVMETCPRCKGLPQVIVSLGASLSLKQNTQSTFQRRLKQLDWVSKHNLSLDETSKCLYVAYINLPMHLKVCLLYCGIFPAGHLLLREKLVRLLVAEGFIEKQKPSEVEEEIAEGYLTELTRWGFLQRVDRHKLEKVASLRMPIVVHELVQSICRKEGFGSAPDDVELTQTDTNVRCLFITKYTQDIRRLIDLPHLRTLIASESAAADSHLENPVVKESHSPDIDSIMADVLFTMLRTVLLEEHPQKRSRYLTVLELQGSPLKTLPDVIGNLFNLRYLGLRKTKVRDLPSSMSRLYNMQTLDLESSNITELPHWIGKLARLRHLLASGSVEENQRKILSGVGAAKSVKKLKELQTLETVEANEFFVKSVDMLTQLRSLCISNVDSKSWRTLLDKMSKLCSLTSFAVSAKDGNEVFDLAGVPFEPLKSLELSSCKLGDNALTLLSNKFKNLVSLSLYKVSGISELAFHVEDFTKLSTLNLQELSDVEKLLIPDGALSSLQVLHVESLTKLNVVTVRDPDTIKDLFFPQMGDLATTIVAESSSRAD